MGPAGHPGRSYPGRDGGPVRRPFSALRNFFLASPSRAVPTCTLQTTSPARHDEDFKLGGARLHYQWE